MTQFIQLHLLAAYPPSNPNRDDTGRPKTAIVGGALRQRISSQALKRAWRASEIFESSLKDHLGKRTRRMGIEVRDKLIKRGVAEKSAIEAAQRIAEVFGKRDGDSVEIKQLAHFSPDEIKAIDSLVEKISSGGKLEEADLNLLREKHKTADIALFGRMLADKPAYNMEAACQVANAITVHRVDLDDDFFTAVDDLNIRREDMGSGHMGETGFASGLYYLYLCIAADRLRENLGDDMELAKTTLQVLLEAAATVAPSGMQNRFGSRVCASYIMAERGNQQPRNLSLAFFNTISGGDLQLKAIEKLEETCIKMDEVYGPRADARRKATIIPCKEGKIEDAGTLASLKQFICEVYDA